jgi:hypothetical protein
MEWSSIRCGGPGRGRRRAGVMLVPIVAVHVSRFLGKVVVDGAPVVSARLGVVLDVPAGDVADADVLEIEGLAGRLAWVPLPLPGTPMMMYLRIPLPALMRRSWDWRR